MSLLAVKLILTPLLIAATTLTVRRWGPAVGGCLTGLPLTSGPVSVFLALEQGPAFAAQAGRGTLLGLVGVTAFCAAYARSAHKNAWPRALAIGVIAYLVVTLGLSFIPSGLTVTALLVFLLIFASLLSVDRPAEPSASVSAPWWDLPARMLTATAIVLLITGLAQTLGPRWSGLLSPFPVFTSVLAVFAHRQAGPASAQGVLRGVIIGVFAAATFFVIVELFVERLSPALVYTLATGLALAVNGLSLVTLVRPKAKA